MESDLRRRTFQTSLLAIDPSKQTNVRFADVPGIRQIIKLVGLMQGTPKVEVTPCKPTVRNPDDSCSSCESKNTLSLEKERSRKVLCQKKTGQVLPCPVLTLKSQCLLSRPFNLLTSYKTSRHAKRAEGRAQQHYGGPAIRNRTTTRTGSETGVPCPILYLDVSRH